MKRRKPSTFVEFFLIIAFFFLQVAQSQVLEPPYFDIAKGKKISATASCGYGPFPNSNLRTERELFCKLAGVPGKLPIGGQYCDFCVPGDRGRPSKDHRVQFANDGSPNWWQSPPLSRGLEFERINITIDLGQVRKKKLTQFGLFISTL